MYNVVGIASVVGVLPYYPGVPAVFSIHHAYSGISDVFYIPLFLVYPPLLFASLL